MSLELHYRVNGGEWKKTHSFVRNWMKFLKAFWFHDPFQSITDVGGTTRSIPDTNYHAGGYYFLNGYALAGIDTKGIVVGTSDAAKDYEGYALGAKISHGDTSGKLNYRDEGIVRSGTSAYHTAVKSRQFINNTVSTITVKEFGVYVGAIYYTGYQGITGYFMIFREVLASPIDVQAGKTLTIELSWEVSV